LYSGLKEIKCERDFNAQLREERLRVKAGKERLGDKKRGFFVKS
jgi:hypothetical protein